MAQERGVPCGTEFRARTAAAGCTVRRSDRHAAGLARLTDGGLSDDAEVPAGVRGDGPAKKSSDVMAARKPAKRSDSGASILLAGGNQ